MPPPGHSLCRRQGQDHHRIAIEADLQFQIKIGHDPADRFEVRPQRSGDHHPQGQGLHAVAVQRRQKSRRHGRGERPAVIGSRRVRQCAILRDHGIKKRQPRADAAQVLKRPAGDQQQLPAGCLQPLQSGGGRIRQDSVSARVPS